MQLRKVLKNRGHFPSDEAATKLIYLALRNITKPWTNPPLTWKMAPNQFAILQSFSYECLTSGSWHYGRSMSSLYTDIGGSMATEIGAFNTCSS